jgi:Xaa-Pro aminopeptidase
MQGVKTQHEIGLIIKAQAITDEVFGLILPFFKAGVSERYVFNVINNLIKERGAEPAFETIVAFGKGSAEPHHVPTDEVLQKNDVIKLDFGAKLNGYCSDMTRMLAIGNPPEKFFKTYDAVLGAQENALKHLKAGITGKEGDSLARDYLKQRGLDQFFTHTLGHSIGKDVHELPRLSQKDDSVIQKNTVMSVEPGVYFDGEFGVRIEDLVVFKNTHVENLTKTSKKLIIVASD